MEFWLLTSEYPPFYGGGIATYSSIVAQIQVRNFEKVRIFTPITGKRDKFEQIGNLEIHRFSVSKWSSLDLIGSDAALASGAKNYLDHLLVTTQNQKFMEITDWGGIGYFILEAHHNLDFDFDFPIILSSHGPSTVMKEYNEQRENSLKDFLLKKLEFDSYLYADFIIFPTIFARNKIQELIPNLDSNKTKIIKYPLAIQTVPSGPRSPTVDFLYFGRKQYLKGFDLFLGAFRDQVFKNKVIGTLGGDSWFYHSSKFGSELQSESGVEIIDSGMMKPEDVHYSLSNAKVIVLPSRVEWYSYAYYEALSSGARIVLSDATGTKELACFFDNLNTFTFRNGSSAELCKQAIHALGSKNEFSQEKILEKTDELNSEYIKSYLNIVNALEGQSRLKSKVSNEVETTVVIPHHNLSRFLSDAIKSVQLASNVAVIVIDDGSTSVELTQCREICKKHKVELIETSNQGLAATRNLGLKISKTPYILFLDSDDQIEPHYIKESILILDNFPEVGFVGASIELISESGKPKGSWRAWTPVLPLNYFINTINSAGVVWRKSTLQEINGFNTDFKFGFEDWDAVNRALATGAQAALAPKSKFIYRIRNGSMFQRMDHSKKAQMYSLIEESIDNLQDKAEVERLVREHGPGYLQANFAKFLSKDALKYVMSIKNRLPFALKIWKCLPLRIKSWIFRRIASH